MFSHEICEPPTCLKTFNSNSIQLQVKVEINLLILRKETETLTALTLRSTLCLGYLGTGLILHDDGGGGGESCKGENDHLQIPTQVFRLSTLDDKVPSNINLTKVNK